MVLGRFRSRSRSGCRQKGCRPSRTAGWLLAQDNSRAGTDSRSRGRPRCRRWRSGCGRRRPSRRARPGWRRLVGLPVPAAAAGWSLRWRDSSSRGAGGIAHDADSHASRSDLCHRRSDRRMIWRSYARGAPRPWRPVSNRRSGRRRVRVDRRRARVVCNDAVIDPAARSSPRTRAASCVVSSTMRADRPGRAVAGLHARGGRGVGRDRPGRVAGRRLHLAVPAGRGGQRRHRGARPGRHRPGRGSAGDGGQVARCSPSSPG